jgi:transposase InsO family protein
VLRGPLEAKQYTSLRYADRLDLARITASVGSVGDSYDNALAESTIGLYKTELIAPHGPWNTRDQLELATESVRTVHAILPGAQMAGIRKPLRPPGSVGKRNRGQATS